MRSVFPAVQSPVSNVTYTSRVEDFDGPSYGMCMIMAVEIPRAVWPISEIDPTGSSSRE